MNGILRWLDKRFPLMKTWRRYLSDYYLPKNLNVYYCFGALALVVLLNQLLTGIMLTMFYTPTANEAFNSIEYIMREVNFGWLFRYMHSTGASAFFIVLYLHLYRALLYGSYQRPRELVWLLGISLFLLLLLEAFFGYLLPWGQMSYWGAQVITSLLGVIPYFGDDLVTWVRGDFIVGDATLHRFFALHIMAIPFGVVFFVFLHIVSLHHVGSNNPDGIDITRYCDNQGKPLDGIPFYPYYFMKDFVAVLIFLILFFSIVFFFPDMGGYFLEMANFAPANSLQTPEHITPMWYMAPFYAILRAIPNKTWGVVTMLSSLFILFFLPWIDKSPVRSLKYKGYYSKCATYSLVTSFFILGYLGTVEWSDVHYCIARISTTIYFSCFLLMPLYTRLERCKTVPERILV